MTSWRFSPVAGVYGVYGDHWVLGDLFVDQGNRIRVAFVTFFVSLSDVFL